MSGEAELFPTTGSASNEAGGSYQVLARRARPQNFADVIGQEHVTQTLVNALRTGRVAHAFVFSGMRGVGKTTTARILAKALNCEQGPTAEPCNRCRNCIEITEGRSLDVFEVDAASQTGIDAARELLETVKYQPAGAKHRIYIIDEAHGLSKQAVDAFLKTLEEPPPHVKFILATTAANKLPATVLSRCQRYDFRAVAAETVAAALGAIASREGVEAEPEALLAIARESGGSMRDATSLLDQVLAFSGGKLDASAIAESLGLPDRRALRELFAAIAVREPATALDVLARVHAQGTDLSRLCADLLERLRNLSVLAVAGRGVLADLQPAEIDELEEAGKGVDPADLQRWFRIVLDTLGDAARAPDPRLVVEMAVVRMASMEPLVGIGDLVARLEAIESGSAPPPGTRGTPGSGPSRPSPSPSSSAGPATGRPAGPAATGRPQASAGAAPGAGVRSGSSARSSDGVSEVVERPAAPV
ncbi:MAG: DNA polymerase III subunit gamma/tau, partial [Alphaproteobacteria bacterium]